MQSPLFDQSPHYASDSFPTLRPFQATAHERLREGALAGHRLQMICAPTGAGKTILGMNVIQQALRKGKRAIFVCDRTTLINQTSAVADQLGLSAHGIIQADHWRTDYALPFQIASVQTLARRRWPAADVIVIDEAHTQYSAWTKHVQACDAKVIGLSATPFSPGLGKIFTNLINAATMHELTESGVLVPLRIFSGSRPDMLGAATAGGEWTDSAAAERGMEIIGDVVAEWGKHAEGRKTIVFGATIAHCEEICRQFNEAGVPAAVFTSNTPDGERQALLKEYAKPDSSLRVLISVEALAKGFDVKDVGCVCDCRPLRKSLSTAIQMWGRGLRSSPETGKSDCLLLDFSGNIIRFAEDFSSVFFNGLSELDAGEKLDKAIRKDEEKPEKACPACGFTPFGGRCIACGHEPQSRSMVEHLAGELGEIRIGKTKYADNARHLWEQCCGYVRGHGKPETQAARAFHLFKDITGDKPPREWSFEATLSAPVSRPVLNKIKQKAIAWRAAQRRAA